MIQSRNVKSQMYKIIISQLTEKTDYLHVPDNEQSNAFIHEKLVIDNTACSEIKKNTRAQSKSTEWHNQHKSCLT